MRVSVAISTYQRAGLLPALVAALQAQTLPADEFEVVIADNGTTDHTREVLTQIRSSSSIRLRVVRIDGNRGPAGGRNAAWREATSPIVAFTDDDCIPTPGWLAAGLRAMDGAARIVVGRTIPDPAKTSMRGPFSLTMTVEEPRFFETCNIFYRRIDLEAAGGFNETFTTPGGEDTDLALRVKATGVQSVFAGDALVLHDVAPSSFSRVIRQTLRWTDIPLFFRIHPDARQTLLHRRRFWRPSHPRVIAAMVGLPAGLIGAWWSPWWLGALALAVPWLLFRVVRRPLHPGRRRRVLALPGAFAVDALEVLVMLRGSLRHRTLVL